MMFQLKSLNIALLTFCGLSVGGAYAATLQQMTDDQMSETTGQAMFSLNYIAPGDAGNYYTKTNGNVGFYKLGLEAEVSLNANIKNLQLGCGGTNGANGCDIEISNFSLGCVADASGNCLSLLPDVKGSATNNPAAHTTSGSTITDISQANQIKDFVLSNPFFQFGIKNPESASTREVLGVRIGAENAKGPMSFNDIMSFSGYLSGTANITMQKKDNLAFTTNSEYNGRPDTNGNLGLADWDIALGIYASKVRADITKDVTRTWAVSNSGNRFNYAQIMGANLDGVVNEVVDSVDNIETTTIFPNWMINLMFPILKSSVKDKVKEQLAAGLGINKAQLSNFNLNYNLSNVGSLDIDSPSFGITVQSQNLYYPGYVAYDTAGKATTTPVAMTKGWGMYLPAAFTLNISQPLDVFTSSILGGSAKAGNIVGLPAPYRNCYGNLTFC